MVIINRHVGLPLYPTGTRPKGDGIVLSPFLCDGVVEFPSRCLVSGVFWLLPLGGHRTRSVAEW